MRPIHGILIRCPLSAVIRMNDSTYQSLIQLITWLIGRYDLGIEDVIRHYDITGKICPKYFVENEDAWNQFKSDVKAVLDNAK